MQTETGRVIQTLPCFCGGLQDWRRLPVTEWRRPTKARHGPPPLTKACQLSVAAAVARAAGTSRSGRRQPSAATRAQGTLTRCCPLAQRVAPLPASPAPPKFTPAFNGHADPSLPALRVLGTKVVVRGFWHLRRLGSFALCIEIAAQPCASM